MTRYRTAWNHSNVSSSKGLTWQKESGNLRSHYFSNFSQFPSSNQTQACFLKPAHASASFSIWSNFLFEKKPRWDYKLILKAVPALSLSPQRNRDLRLNLKGGELQQMQRFPGVFFLGKQNNKKALRYYPLSTWKDGKVAQSTFSSQHFLTICGDRRPAQLGLTRCRGCVIEDARVTLAKAPALQVPQWAYSYHFPV